MIFGGVALMVGVFALVVLFNEGLVLIGCTAATPMGWIVPLVSVVVIAAAAWYLLSQAEKDPLLSEEFPSIACPSCGRNVLAEWRMCPYCGASVPASDAGPQTADAAPAD